MKRKTICILVFIICLISAENLFAQIDVPDKPKFISASIIPDSDPTIAVLKWNPSDSLDVSAYIIYNVVDGITEIVDTVHGRLSTSYEHTGTLASLYSETYRMAAIDIYEYKSQITDPHRTVYLKTEFDKCNSLIKLVWSEYLGWESVSNYNIYRRTNTTNYELIATLSADVASYTDNNVGYDATYHYYVEAVSPDNVRATSNSSNVFAQNFIIPKYLLTKNIEVQNNNAIDVSFFVDPDAEVMMYEIQRSNGDTLNFKTISSINNTQQSEITYLDSGLYAEDTVYYYRVVSINPCNVISSYSDISSNILLKAKINNTYNHDIEWEINELDINSGIETYDVYRYFNYDEIYIGTNSNDNNIFHYNIERYVTNSHANKIFVSNEFCYYIIANTKSNSEFINFSGKNVSNISCVYLSPIVHIPNALNLASVNKDNREFKPIVSFIKEGSYEFSVYSRWGELIFRTNDPNESWSPKELMEIASPQNYIYLLKYKDADDKSYRKSGVFMLLVE